MTFGKMILSLQKSRINFVSLSDSLQVMLSKPIDQIPDTMSQVESIISDKKELKGLRSSVIYYRKEVITLTKLALENFKLANLPPEKKIKIRIDNYNYLETWYTEKGKVQITGPFQSTNFIETI